MMQGNKRDSYNVEHDGGSCEVRVDGVEVPAIWADAKKGVAFIDVTDEHGRYVMPKQQKTVKGKVEIIERY